MQYAEIERQLLDYGRRWPGELETVEGFLAILADPRDPFVRERLAGHFTGSAWVVSADGQRTLLTHHRKLDRWLQPGGHADGDTDLARVHAPVGLPIGAVSVEEIGVSIAAQLVEARRAVRKDVVTSSEPPREAVAEEALRRSTGSAVPSSPACS